VCVYIYTLFLMDFYIILSHLLIGDNVLVFFLRKKLLKL
jgi:hypothetical protein